MKRCLFALLFMITYLAFIPSFNPLIGGGPPLVTDDTGTPGHNKWEINLSYTTRNTIHERETGATLDVNYGLGEKTQLNLVIPHTSLDRDEEGHDNDIGDVQFSTKYRFIDEMGWVPSISSTPTIFIPTDNGHEKPDFFFPLEFDRNIKSFYVGAQFGYFIHREKGENNEVFYGFFCEHPVFEKIDAVGEIFGFVIEDEETKPPQFNAGFRYRFSKLFSVMGSAGRSFEEHSKGEPHFLGYIGVRLNY